MEFKLFSDLFGTEDKIAFYDNRRADELYNFARYRYESEILDKTGKKDIRDVEIPESTILKDVDASKTIYWSVK